MPRGRGGHGFGAGRAKTLVEFSGLAPAVAGVEEEDRERQVRLVEAWLGPDRAGRVANLGSKECEGALGHHGATGLLPKCVSTCRVTPTPRRSLGR